ncbi:Evolutionarily conserved signaling intermediate in Toll [Nesidiocoris tenuis]|uniref:Evolutionarily conserved signaling intermediate in Toll pathway, mitochondrial n=2 Tax=Nesidiocoris tenuis TaxID=355587 RepID=A0ABN7B334_9HEMI|nr:Evolutionarily conserved signaling intermediate in Toll [Nesidiocoris tenuis]
MNHRACQCFLARRNVTLQWIAARSSSQLIEKSEGNFWKNAAKSVKPRRPPEVRRFATKPNHDPPNKELVSYDDFGGIANKNKETYLEMVNLYKDSERLRRGHVEFIYSALRHMKEFGVEKDLQIYKALVDVFPKGKMIPRNIFQVEFMHYPKHQQCAIDLLDQMEQNGVIPDWDMEDQLVNVFGRKGHPVRKYARMMYWMPKFKNASPWCVPDSLSSDPYQLARYAVERIMSVDIATKISTFKTEEIPDALDHTWIVSGQSPDQQRLLADLPKNTPVYVEGRFQIRIMNHVVTYFVLRADIKLARSATEENYDDVSNMYIPLFSKPREDLVVKPTVHEQEDGIILGICCTGTSSRDSLLSWIRSLEKENPRLADLTVVFTLKAPQDETSLAEVETEVVRRETDDEKSEKTK